MISSRSRALRALPVAAFAAAALIVSACGGDDATKLEISFTKSGKYEVPKSVKGGLVEVELTNNAKGPADAQLVRYDAGHSADEALKLINSDAQRVPAWIHGAGGPGTTAAGETQTTTTNLPAGNYFVTKSGEEGGPSESAPFEVTDGEDGDLPETDVTVTAKDAGEDAYAFTVDGELKAGDNEITFDNQSANQELHHALFFPIAKGKTFDDVNQAFQSEKGEPPLDFEKGVGTTVTDGGTTEVTQLKLDKGSYALICFITDRDGKGGDHAGKGMLTEVEVK